MQILPVSQWRELEARHHARVDDATAGYLARRSRGQVHPVEDFLFTYYTHRPARLHRWHPGTGVRLEGAAEERVTWRGYRTGAVDAWVDAVDLDTPRGRSVRAIRALLVATAGRAPITSCFGLHEWAMVYGQSAQQVRHDA